MTDTALSRIAHKAAIATAVIAFLGLGIAVWQIEVGKRVQREASARDAFKEYLKLAIERPEFADARLGKAAQNENGRSGYGWFVSYFLFSAEQIHDSFPDDPEWSAALGSQICYHAAYLKGAEYQTMKAHYAPSFAKFIDESLRQCGK
jgi:hypothetical protein